MNVKKHEPTLVNLKLRDDQKKELLRQCLNGVCADCSIQLPDKRIIERLIDFILESYPTIRISEITKAFDMNASGNYWQTVQTFGKLDKMIVGGVIAKYLAWRREKYRHQGNGSRGPGKPWTPKDSYDVVMEYKAKHKRLPENVGVYLWAYKYACEAGIMKFDPKEWDGAMMWARSNIDHVRKPSKGKEITMMVIKTKPDDDLKYLAAKHLFTKHLQS